MGRTGLSCYAAMAMPLAFLGLPLYVYVPAAYAQLPRVGLAAAGVVLLAARLLDLVTDPLVGVWVDRLRQRLHPLAWMVVGIPVMGAGAWWLLTPQQDAGILYLTLSISLTYLGWTLVAVPYYAWGAELGADRPAHRQVAVWREGGTLAGALAALVLTGIAAGDPLPVMRDALIWLLVMATLVLWWVPRPEFAVAPAGLSLRDAWRHTGTSMRRLLGLHLLNALAAGVPATLFLLFAEHVLLVDMRLSGLLLLGYFLSAMIALPVWLAIARRYGELNTWLIAILVCVLGFVPAIFTGPGDWPVFAAVCLVTGATLSADVAMPAAIQARLAQLRSEQLGISRQAVAFGLWGMAGKLALAAAAGISLPVLGLFEPGEARTSALPWLYAALPAVIKLAVAWMLVRHRERLTDLSLPEDSNHALQNLHPGATGTAARRL